MKFLKTTIIEIIDGCIAEAEKALAEAEAAHAKGVAEAEKAHEDFFASLDEKELMKQFKSWLEHRGHRNTYIYLSRNNGETYHTPEYMMKAYELPHVPGKFNPSTHQGIIESFKRDKRMLELSDGATVTINSVNSKFGRYVS